MAAKKQRESYKSAFKQPKAERSRATPAPPASAARARIRTGRSRSAEACRGASPVPVDEHFPVFEAETAQLNSLLGLLLRLTKYDFRCYRKGVLAHRIGRRMESCQVDQLSDYLEFVRSTPEEVKQLSRELLLGFGGFFRELEAFKALEEHVLPEIVARSAANRNGNGSGSGSGNVRVWVPGCASGEEAYSIGILLREQIEAAKNGCRFRIFASDIDEEALQIARRGIYLKHSLSDVSPQQLARFFTPVSERSYCVEQHLRESVVFSPQNLIGDIPFSRIDLISCRNLLVYFEPEVQARIIELLHYTLNEGGYLMLGSQESIGEQTDLFEPVSKRWRLYRRRGPIRRSIVDIPLYPAKPKFGPPLVMDSPVVGRTASPRDGMTERLQSAREDLAVAMEELQSLNEELHTVNGEMEVRIQERTAQLEAANRELEADIGARKALEQEVLGIAVEEQRRIGQELHDGMGQELTGLGLMIQGLVESLAEKSLPEAKTAMRIAEGLGRALGQVRLLARGLIPADVDGSRLRTVLAELAARTGEVNGVCCSFQCDEPIESLDNTTATHLARIAQEAITNALKHGRARHIVVSLERRGAALALKILDDGVGIGNLPEASQGVGLRIMRHRANLIGAELRVVPVHGGGTLVTCTLISPTREGCDA
jgi:chemotaxis methyl-accepting protein methylase/two-component sensor histidine kinase